MNLYMVQYLVDGHIYSTEHVWAENHATVEVFAKKHGRNQYRVDQIYAAATTEDKPTPPGLDTYKVIRGKKL